MAEIPIRSNSVSVFVVRLSENQPEVLLLERADRPVGAWCQVAGGIEEGEKAWETALRELNEETSLFPRTFYHADFCIQYFQVTREAIKVEPVFVAFVESAAKVILNEEHTAFRWLSFDDARSLVLFGNQRQALDWIEQEFVVREPSHHLRIDF